MAKLLSRKSTPDRDTRGPGPWHPRKTCNRCKPLKCSLRRQCRWQWCDYRTNDRRSTKCFETERKFHRYVYTTLPRPGHLYRTWFWRSATKEDQSSNWCPCSCLVWCQCPRSRTSKWCSHHCPCPRSCPRRTCICCWGNRRTRIARFGQ